MHWETPDWIHSARCGLVSAEWKGIINSLDLPPVLLLIQSSVLSLLPGFALTGFSPPRGLPCVSAELLPSQSSPSLHRGPVTPRWRMLHLSPQNFMRVLLALSSSKCESLWVAGLVLSIPTYAIHLVSSVHSLIILHPVSYSRSLIKISGRTDPWGIQFVTSFQTECEPI